MKRDQAITAKVRTKGLLYRDINEVFNFVIDLWGFLLSLQSVLTALWMSITTILFFLLLNNMKFPKPYYCWRIFEMNFS